MICHLKVPPTLFAQLLDYYMYTMYTMYMIYKSIADFRKGLRNAFNAADAGEEIEIVRYGKLYRLSPVGNTAKISPDTATKVNKMLLDEGRSKSRNFCANGHAIPDGRDRCMGKGCKYA